MSDLVAGPAIVTGAGSGIGRAIAIALSARGAPVGLVDLFPDGISELAEDLERNGGRAAATRGDVSRWEDVDRVMGRLRDELGAPGILVSAAGVLDGYADLEEMSPRLWERVISINLTGTFHCAKRVLPEMLETGVGRVINIASVAGLVGAGGGPAYVASKHGIVGLTRRLAVMYADRGVTVNAIGPGVVATALRPNSTRILDADAPPVMRGIGGDEAAMRAVTPAGRRGTLEEIAGAACFLASAGAGYITGQTLAVDGGWTAQ